MANLLDGVYTNLIQGVSQQAPLKRLAGQLSEQINMVSDPSTGLRRRRGFRYNEAITDLSEHVKWQYLNMSGTQYLCAVDYLQGKLHVFSDKGVRLGELESPYLVGDYASVQLTSNAGFGVILNTKHAPYVRVLEQRTKPQVFFEIKEGETDLSGNLLVHWKLKGDDKLYSNIIEFLTGDGVDSNKDNPTKLGYKHVSSTGAVPYKEYADGLLSVAGTTNTVTVEAAKDDTDSLITDDMNSFQRVVTSWATYNTPKAKEQGTKATISGNHKIEMTSVVNNGLLEANTGIIAKNSQLVTAEGIAAMLQYGMNMANLGSPYTVTRVGSKVLITGWGNVEYLYVNSSLGETYIQTSGSNTEPLVPTEERLPNQLPQEARGMVVGVGASYSARQYFRYTTSGAWVECAEFGEISAYHDMPFMFQVFAPSPEALREYNASIGTNRRFEFQNWTLEEFKPTFQVYNAEGVQVRMLGWPARYVGNAENNDYAYFVTGRLTGMGAYQGRLVLLSGAYVHMSDSTNLFCFTRTTVTDQLDTECIHIQSLNVSSLAFKYAVEFNKDLVCLSDTQQTTIPNPNGQALTVKNARIFNSSVANMNMTHAPCVIGKDLYYGSTNNLGFASIGQLQVNTLVDNQFNPVNLSSHIPRYYKGDTTSLSGNSTSGTAIATNGTKNLLVWNFLADNDAQQSAFSTWTLPFDVHYGWFMRDIFGCVMLHNGVWFIASYISTYGQDDTPFMDLFIRDTVLVQKVDVGVETLFDGYVPPSMYDDEFSFIPWPYSFNPDRVVLNAPDTEQHLKEIKFYLLEIPAGGRVVVVDKALPAGTSVIAGIKYTSVFEPSPVQHKDYDALVQYQGNLNVTAYTVMVKDSGDCTLHLETPFSQWTLDNIVSTFQRYKVGSSDVHTSTFRVPVRSDSEDLKSRWVIDGCYDFNIVQLGWTARVHRSRDVYR